MATTTVTTYDGKGNVIEERTVEVPDDRRANARRQVEQATTVAQLKAALLAFIDAT